MSVVIPASNPVVAPAIPSITYDQWFLTYLQVNTSPTAAPAQVRLHRSTSSMGKPF